MTPGLKRKVLRAFPELESGFHLPMLAEVIAITDPPTESSIADNYRPRLAVDVELLTSQYGSTGIIFHAVPVSNSGGGHERGMFALPEIGTLVELAFLNGSSELPFIRSVLPHNKQNPVLGTSGQTWQQSEDVKQSVDNAGHWKRVTHNKITDEASTIIQKSVESLISIVNESKSVSGQSVEEITGVKKVEAGAIHLLAEVVLNHLSTGSINQVAMEFITRSSTKGLIDHTKGDVKRELDGNLQDLTKGNATYQADKLHVGNESNNLLKLVSDTINELDKTVKEIAKLKVTCASPGSPSSVPITASKFTAISSAVSSIKSKVDAMTL